MSDAALHGRNALDSVSHDGLPFFVGGLAAESNSFTEVPTIRSDFTVITPDAPREAWLQGEAHVVTMIADSVRSQGYAVTQGSCASADPGGRVLDDVYFDLRDGLLDEVARALPVRGVVLYLHGGMSAETVDDCELDIVTAVRELVGSAPIGLLFDLHCDVSPALIRSVNIIVTLKEYPHTDYAERASEVASLVLATAEKSIDPTIGVADSRTAGNMPTTVQPMRDFVDSVLRQSERRPRVLSASLIHGNPWLDSVNYGSRALVITDGDHELAVLEASRIASALHAIRHEAVVRPVPVDNVIAAVKSNPRGRFLIAEAPDNPGGGAPGDATHLLSKLLLNGVENAALGPLYDPAVVRLAFAQGIGRRFNVRLGGKLSRFSGEPLDVDAEVVGLRRELNQIWPQIGAPRLMPTGDCAGLRIGGLEVVVSSIREQAVGTNLFTEVGIPVEEKSVVAVKSANHFRAAFATGGRSILLAETAGLCRNDLLQLEFRDTNRYPWRDLSDLDAYL